MKILLGLVLLTFLYPMSFALETKDANSVKQKVSLLFVLPANKASIISDKTGKLLVLKVPDKKIMFFSDRPNRIAGNMPLEKFVQGWNKGKDSFKMDPPNAVLVHAGSEKGITLELTSVRLSDSGNTLIFSVIGKGKLTNAKGAFLFIDAALAEYAVIL
ncbi:hypothetical protein L3V82_13095 [Thiotrichales bacterium 19S3-7]|nr:hypothetical protein [Thiotrichales bacterium 19S3-7]